MDNFLDFVSDNLLFVSAFIPLFVGLLVKSTASRNVKSVVMIIVNGIVALAASVGDAGVLSKEMASSWLFGIVVSVATYYGVWQPVTVGGTSLGNIAPDKGIG
jgi:hypothetical protein